MSEMPSANHSKGLRTREHRSNARPKSKAKKFLFYTRQVLTLKCIRSIQRTKSLIPRGEGADGSMQIVYTNVRPKDGTHEKLGIADLPDSLRQPLQLRGRCSDGWAL